MDHESRTNGCCRQLAVDRRSLGQYAAAAEPQRWGIETMRTADVQPVLDALILGLGERLSQIQFDSLFAAATFKEGHAELVQQTEHFAQRASGTAQNHGYRQMWAAMTATDVRGDDPVWIAIGGRQAQDEEFVAMLVENLNGQLLWLLVQAFEAIEKFYKDFYGALGYLDERLWQCADFGNVRLPELTALSLSWHQDQVRRTIGKHNVDGILNSIRRVFPSFAAAETNVTRNVDLALWFDAAAFFRHMIVHGRASIPEADLVPRLTEATGQSFTGKDKSVIMRKWSMVSHFELHNGVYSLWLVDRATLRPPYHAVASRLERILHELASHAALAYAIAMGHFGQIPFWERPHEAPTTAPT